jgi:hypothetical protein
VRYIPRTFKIEIERRLLWAFIIIIGARAAWCYGRILVLHKIAVSGNGEETRLRAFCKGERPSFPQKCMYLVPCSCRSFR